MSFQPVIPFGGFSGWKFLSNTLDSQKAAFASTAEIQRDTDYFKANIGKVTTADQLVSDRRLLKVALGAFGLDADINNTFFMRKVLSESTSDPQSLANKLADKKYLTFAKAFGLGDGTPLTQSAGFGETISKAYDDRQFEIAVGKQDDSLRLALALKRDLTAVANSGSANDTKWFTVMGSPPLRKVFEMALGLPTSFAALDIDQQLTMFRDKATRAFGNGEIGQFTDPAKLDDLARMFLVRSQAQSNPIATSGASLALQLLQGG